MKKMAKKLKTKQDLIYEIAKKEKLALPSAHLLVNTVFHEITQALLRGQRVQIRGFAGFGLKKRKAYKGMNPKTQKKVKVQAKNRLWFKVGLFNKRLNKK